MPYFSIQIYLQIHNMLQKKSQNQLSSNQSFKPVSDYLFKQSVKYSKDFTKSTLFWNKYNFF